MTLFLTLLVFTLSQVEETFLGIKLWTISVSNGTLSVPTTNTYRTFKTKLFIFVLTVSKLVRQDMLWAIFSRTKVPRIRDRGISEDCNLASKK